MIEITKEMLELIRQALYSSNHALHMEALKVIEGLLKEAK